MAETSISSPPPTLSTTLAITPSTFHSSSTTQQASPSITLEVTSHALQPITIFTWPTIFNLNLSQKRRNFQCLDVTTNKFLHLELTKGPKRLGFSRVAGGRDDAYFCTLEPETSVSFSATFILARRSPVDQDALVPGHWYRFTVREGEKVSWWRYGVKADVMAPAGQPAMFGDASGPPLALDGINAVEFQVLDADAAAADPT